MATLTALYRVRPGMLLPHAGTRYAHPDVVELPRHVAVELTHLVVEVDVLGAEVLPDTFAAELEASRPHERSSLLQAEREKVARRLEELDVAIRAEASKDIAAEEQAARAKASAPHRH